MTNKSYKTFDDLEFKPHIPGKAVRAIVPISNGWVISVIEWLGIYASLLGKYECACVYEEPGYIGFLQIPGSNDAPIQCADKNKVNWAMEQFQELAKTQ